MQFPCQCGSIIRDTTDRLTHKAHLIADEDWFEVNDAEDRQLLAIVKLAMKSGDSPALREAMEAFDGARVAAERAIYECEHCGRLHVRDRNGRSLLTYAPEGPDRGVLRRHMKHRS